MLTTSPAPIWELHDEERPVEGLDEHGAPDPAYAAALGMVSAPLGKRFAAAAMDVGIFVLLQVPFLIFGMPLFWRWMNGRISRYGFTNHPDFLVSVIVLGVTLLLTIFLIVAQLVMQGRWGFTLGKLALGLRAVNVRTLAQPGFLRTAGRGLVVWVPIVTVVGPIVFMASPLWSRLDRRRGWHDKIGSTWLVDARAGLNPYDAKRMRIARKTITSTPAPRAKGLPSLATASGIDASHAYRPGARTSAGVLGAARPHPVGARVKVGLSGLEPGAPAPMVQEGNSEPRLGSYLPAGEPTGGSHRLGVPAASGTALHFDSGQRIQLLGAVVLGRSPASVDGAQPLAVIDPDFSISKTHVMLRPVPGGLEVIDQGSTNGTALLREGQELPLAPGEVGMAAFGDSLRIGERTALVVGS